MPKGPERGLLHLSQGEIVSEACSLYRVASPNPQSVRFVAGRHHSDCSDLYLKVQHTFIVGSIPPLATILFNGLCRFRDSLKRPLREFCVNLTDYGAAAS